MTGDADFVICGESYLYCKCVLPQHGPDTPHQCDAGCGGSWTHDEAGKFIAVTMPCGVATGRPRRLTVEGGRVIYTRADE
jgi:hypothetical protein